ncbi:MAG TPA: vanadium-dependent haloperoxidase [Puia sp.]|nr:vanadium-dependent haloperoxidase [Puia sp.]
MKQFLPVLHVQSKHYLLICLVMAMVCVSSCRKSGDDFRDELSRSSFSADVIDKWLTLEIRLFTHAVGISNGGFTRHFAYSGICAYESIDPGVASWKDKYNGLSGLPETEKHKRYHWPASVNASLAEFNRSFFTSTNSNATDIAAIDSLENAIYSTFNHVGSQDLSRSVGFGKSIADAIFAWSQTDGYNENNLLPYTLPVGPGLWELTPPAFAKPIGPFWRNDRPIIAGSGNNAQPGPPMAYSEDPKSPFYQMVNDLYVASKSLTTDQQNWALFWRDIPGVTTPGHWMSIIQQVIRQTHSRLDKAALTFALVGICLTDGNISVMTTKYTYNLLRPVTYIRKVIGDATWLSFIPTPAHPEYSSAHSVVSAAASEALTAIYGNIGPFTDHTWDYLGFPTRTFNTFRAIGVDAGNSRFYGGIHYQPSIDAGLKQGRIVGTNILNRLLPFSEWEK